MEKEIAKYYKSPIYYQILNNKNNFEIIVKDWDSKNIFEKRKLLKERSEHETNIKIVSENLKSEPNFIEELNKILELYNKKNYFHEKEKIYNVMKDIQSKIELDQEIFEKIKYISEKVNNSKLEDINVNKKQPLKNKSKFKYLIKMLSLTEVKVIDLEIDINKTHIIKLDASCFIDNSYSEFHNLRFFIKVNIGDSIFVTGRDCNTYLATDCYILQITKQDNIYKIRGRKYSSMQESKIDPTIIYLEDMNKILVCERDNSTKKYVEITDLDQGTWKKRSPVKVNKSDAILLYFNHKTVFCFGENNKINSSSLYKCESIDIKDPNASWNDVSIVMDVGTYLNINLRGVAAIHLDSSNFLLFGGHCYNNLFPTNFEVFEVIIQNDNNWKISKNSTTKEELSFDEPFMKCSNNEYLNYDISNRLVKYSLDKKQFNIIK